MYDDLEQEYHRITFWISNIDSKISFALGASGVLLGFILSNENLGKTLKKHLNLIKTNNLDSIIFFSLFGITICLLVLAMWYFLRGLKARINPKKFSQPQMVFPSNIFWGDIAKNDYFTYKYRLDHYGKVDWIEDMKTQIYINSSICNQKTNSYNCGINCLMFSLFSFVFYHLWLWFFI